MLILFSNFKFCQDSSSIKLQIIKLQFIHNISHINKIYAPRMTPRVCTAKLIRPCIIWQPAYININKVFMDLSHYIEILHIPPTRPRDSLPVSAILSLRVKINQYLGR